MEDNVGFGCILFLFLFIFLELVKDEGRWFVERDKKEVFFIELNVGGVFFFSRGSKWKFLRSSRKVVVLG